MSPEPFPAMAFIRLLPGMDPAMILEIAGGSKRFWTEITPIVSFSCVNSSVNC